MDCQNKISESIPQAPVYSQSARAFKRNCRISVSSWLPSRNNVHQVLIVGIDKERSRVCHRITHVSDNAQALTFLSPLRIALLARRLTIQQVEQDRSRLVDFIFSRLLPITPRVLRFQSQSSILAANGTAIRVVPGALTAL